MFTVSHDYYGILKVSKNATFEEIRRQYRKLAKEHDPNRYMGLANKYRALGDEDLLRVCEDRIAQETEFMKLLNEAYEVLSDPVKRKQYDEQVVDDEQVVEPSVPLPEISIHPTRIAFGSLLEGQEKSLAFTIENKGGPPATVNIDWEGDKPDWGELAIEPDAENVFPIKVTVKVDTTSIPSDPKDEKILIDVDGRIHIVEVFLSVTRPVVTPTPTRPVVAPATPTRTYPSPAPSTKRNFTVLAILAILVILVLAVPIVTGSITNSVIQRSRERSQQVRITRTAVVQAQPLEATIPAEEVDQLPTIVASSVQNGRIAFVSNRDGNQEIYVMNADGTGVIRLTNNSVDDFEPSWSPDGSKIAFYSNRDGNYEIYVMNADGSEQVRLTNHLEGDGDPVWSPDGSKIAFVSNRDGNREIYVMNADGSGQTRLTDNKVRCGDPTWSPDGTRIAFMSSRDSNYEIYVMNADGFGQTNLSNDSKGDVYPSWSPDGTKIAFASDRDGHNQIYMMNADGSGQTRLTDGVALDMEPAWGSGEVSPVAQKQFLEATVQTEASGQSPTIVVSSVQNGRIAFASDRDGNYEIYVMNADGSGQTRLTNNPAWDGVLAWSPDGSRIAFDSDRDSNWEIYVMDTDGTGVTRLTNSPLNDMYPAWGP